MNAPGDRFDVVKRQHFVVFIHLRKYSPRAILQKYSRSCSILLRLSFRDADSLRGAPVVQYVCASKHAAPVTPYNETTSLRFHTRDGIVPPLPARITSVASSPIFFSMASSPLLNSLATYSSQATHFCALQVSVSLCKMSWLIFSILFLYISSGDFSTASASTHCHLPGG